MRAGVVFACLLPSALAVAAPPTRTVVWQDRVITGEVPLTSVSNKLYLHRCTGSSCTVSPGTDSSISNRSSIADSLVTLDAYTHGDEHWNELVACVRDTFKPFDVEIVTDDPGSAAHFEVMIGGTSRQLNPQLEAGGVAPYISCGAARNNGLSFVFSGGQGNMNYLCGAVAQEACHVWGLDHELNAKDPMTYLELGSSKRFQNDDAQCGEDSPRRCRCGGTTQNSFRYMTETFGLNPALGQPSLAILTPRDGAWLKGRFPISAQFTSDLYLLEASLSIDNMVIEENPQNGILAFDSPDLASGSHTIELDAIDAGDRSVAASVTVNVMAACGNGAACANGTHCIAGFCTPGGNVDGGLGAACTGNEDCATGTCASDGTESLCTGSCETGCPDGFECTGAAGVCWPTGGGCSTSGGNTTFAFAALGLGFVLRRRRQ